MVMEIKVNANNTGEIMPLDVISERITELEKRVCAIEDELKRQESSILEHGKSAFGF